jgi:hypothetical protein
LYISSTTKIQRSSLKLIYSQNDLHFSGNAKGEQFQYIKLNYRSLYIETDFNIISCISLVLYIYIYIYSINTQIIDHAKLSRQLQLRYTHRF